MIRRGTRGGLPLPLAAAVFGPGHRLLLNPRVPVGVQRRLADAVSTMHPLPADTRIEWVTLGGRPTARLTVGKPAASTDGAVLLLHGGGYTMGSARTHRGLAAYLARDTGRPVYLIEYRLAPEHPYPAAVDDAVAAIRELIQRYGDAGQIGLVGDSAGGGLALAATYRLRDEDHVVPAALALISPWVDLADPTDRPTDLVVSRAWSMANAAAYCGPVDWTDPGCSPVFGDPTGLPPTLIQVCTRESLYDQDRRLAGILRDAGVEVTLSTDDRMWHDAQLQPGLLREAAAAVAEIAAFLGERLSGTIVEPTGGEVG